MIATTNPVWEEFGTIIIDGTERTIWSYDDSENRKVFQVTTGDEPSSNGGYHSLESLLKLKGVKISDVVPAPTILKP